MATEQDLIREKIRAKIQEQIKLSQLPDLPGAPEPPPTLSDEAKTIMSPPIPQRTLPPVPPMPDMAKYGQTAAQYGLGAAVGQAGADVWNNPKAAYDLAAYPSKVVGALGAKAVNAMTPDIEANPQMGFYKNMAMGTPRALGEIATETAQSMLSPEGVATSVAIPGIGAGLKPLGKAALKKFGKKGLGVAEEATETMIRKPEVMKSGFSGEGRITKVTQDLKIALDDFRKKISKAYDDVLGKSEKAKKPGKGDPEKVMEAFDKLEKPLGVRKQTIKIKTKKGEVEKFDKYVGKKGTQQQVSQEELDKLTELRHKFEQDVQRRGRSGKLTANDLQNETNILGKYTNWKEPGNVYNKELKGLRRTVDKEKRQHYPELKEIDAQKAKLERAAGTIRRRTGIKAGETMQTEVTEQEVNRTQSLIRRLFNTNEDVTRKAVEKAAKDINAGKVMDDIKDLAAAEQLGIDRESWLKNFKTKAAKTLFISAISNAKAMYGKASKSLFKKVLPAYVGREEK